MAEEVKDHVKLETRQSFLKEKQRNLESHREILQDMCKEIVETRVVHLAEVDQKIQSLETQLEGLQDLLDILPQLKQWDSLRIRRFSVWIVGFRLRLKSTRAACDRKSDTL